MGRQSITRILISGVFLVLVMIGAEAAAQTLPHPAIPGITPQTPTKSAQTAQNHSAAESNPACQRILSECKKLGFIQGQWKKDNGLWKDCFDPVVKGGGSATRDGKPITVPVSPADVQACKAAEGHHK